MNNFEDDNKLYLLQVTILAMAYVILLLLRKRSQRICREPSRERLEIRRKYLSRLIDGNDTTSINMVRVVMSIFLHDTLHMSIEQLLIFLNTIGQNHRNHVTVNNFLRSEQIVARYPIMCYMQSVSCAINTLDQ